jgi:hypothetical protein
VIIRKPVITSSREVSLKDKFKPGKKGKPFPSSPAIVINLLKDSDFHGCPAALTPLKPGRITRIGHFRVRQTRAGAAYEIIKQLPDQSSRWQR